jgi:hypothetical protein
VKVLSYLQPWAQLVVLGSKRIETRSWCCAPQRIAVHASLGVSDLHRLFTAPYFYDALEAAGFQHSGALPRGAIVGTVDVVACKPVEELLPQDLTDQERAFGNYDPGRMGWYLKNPVSFPPIPFKGAQGLRELPPEILALVPERAL